MRLFFGVIEQKCGSKTGVELCSGAPECQVATAAGSTISTESAPCVVIACWADVVVAARASDKAKSSLGSDPPRGAVQGGVDSLGQNMV